MRPISNLNATIQELNTVLDSINIRSTPQSEVETIDELLSNIEQRINSIGASVVKTAADSLPQITEAVHVFRDWMVDAIVVRVIGAGRARLAGSIPANRLAHGGARIYIIDDIIPMPHSVRGGGILAVSASGKTESVLSTLKNLRNIKARVKIIGIANKDAEEFARLCHVFIGIQQVDLHNPLQALADTEEYIISMLLDAMVVAAGKLAGFDDTKWRLGHEDIGPTGPYSPNYSDINLSVTVADIDNLKG